MKAEFKHATKLPMPSYAERDRVDFQKRNLPEPPPPGAAEEQAPPVMQSEEVTDPTSPSNPFIRSEIERYSSC